VLQQQTGLFESLFQALPTVSDHHAPSSSLYALLKDTARSLALSNFSDQEAVAKQFPPFGDLVFPYHEMGAINSVNLFAIDELIIFSFYWLNRKRYRRVLDAGANIGLHSIILSKCGYDVRAYEPDPIHFEILRNNLALNDCSGVETVEAALSTEEGESEFVRVMGNTTGSHLAGAKANPYGELERFSVKVEPIQPLFRWADLIKLDVEGHEKDILLATTHCDWMNTDALVEVGSPENAESIHQHFAKSGVNLFAQKTNWQLVRTLDDMPTSHRDGTLFLTCKEAMPWS
jgi:FkbM family methyltransferase